ncbi:hypothetical protein NQ318_015388 [Aromia moschata]|uniref:Uncharacterized protein n=1 Tax=Aromia moschata TaxID=1265417 RepID=A0AAV8YQ40_9CUCU|nr:hypothetical protein NQ318_015388 [Aromia moschata]
MQDQHILTIYFMYNFYYVTFYKKDLRILTSMIRVFVEERENKSYNCIRRTKRISFKSRTNYIEGKYIYNEQFPCFHNIFVVLIFFIIIDVK